MTYIDYKNRKITMKCPTCGKQKEARNNWLCPQCWIKFRRLRKKNPKIMPEDFENMKIIKEMVVFT